MEVSVTKSKTEAMPQELLTFETSHDDLSWLNTAIGQGKDLDLNLTVHTVKD